MKMGRWAWAMIGSAWGVTTTSRGRRSNNGMPSCSSSFLIAALSVGWLTLQTWAAWPK